MRHRGHALLALAVSAAACGGLESAAPPDGRAPPDGSSLDGRTQGEPVSACDVLPMDVQYGGLLPPNPYDPPYRASDCILRAHDAIVVLGCPSNADGTPSACQTRRADLAVALRAAGYGGRFIVSGAAVHNAWVEADALAALLVARGVAPGEVVREPLAEHTDENLYYSALIMAARGWENAVVVSDDPGQLVYTAVCDSNCCVDLGRLTVEGFPIVLGGAPVISKQGHFVLYPIAAPVSDAECRTIEGKAMCVNLAARRACAGRLTLP